MSTELLSAFEQLARERGIASEVLFEAVEAALISAYKRNFGTSQNVRVAMDRETGAIKVFARKDVVETVTDNKQEISLDAAKAIDIAYQIGDIVEQEVTPKDFGRIAAIFRAGCIIQADFLNKITEAYQQQPELSNLMRAPFWTRRSAVQRCCPGCRGWWMSGAEWVISF